jgi:hypothetical protein
MGLVVDAGPGRTKESGRKDRRGARDERAPMLSVALSLLCPVPGERVLLGRVEVQHPRREMSWKQAGKMRADAVFVRSEPLLRLTRQAPPPARRDLALSPETGTARRLFSMHRRFLPLVQGRRAWPAPSPLVLPVAEG